MRYFSDWWILNDSILDDDRMDSAEAAWDYQQYRIERLEAELAARSEVTKPLKINSEKMRHAKKSKRDGLLACRPTMALWQSSRAEGLL